MNNILKTGLDTGPIKMQPMWKLVYQAPVEDIDRILDAVRAMASLVQDVLRSATKGLDDSNNPNRWWNKDGDWKTAS